MNPRKYFQILILISFIQILFTLSTSAQSTYFSKIFDIYNTGSLAKHIIETDSGYIIVGHAIDSSTNNLNIILLKLDKHGDTLEYKKVGKDSLNYYAGAHGSFIKTNDSCYAVTGAIEDSSKTYGILLKFDKQLNVIWQKEHTDSFGPGSNYQSFSQCKQTLDKGFVLVGEIRGAGQYNTDILLLKTDSLGNKEWQKTYNYIGADRGWSVIQTSDKGFLIGAGGYIPGVYHSYNGLVINTDSQGNEKWRKIFGSAFNDTYCIVDNAKDGKYIVGTIYAHSAYTVEVSEAKINIIKLDTNGSIIFNKEYAGIRKVNQIRNIRTLEYGSIIAVGSHDPDTTAFSWGWLLKIGADGDSIWFRNYYKINNQSDQNYLYDVYPTKDNGFIACGQVGGYTVPQSMWVLKVDSFGCDTQGCHTIGINELVISNHELLIYPNPASEEIIFDFYDFKQGQAIDIVIYNAVGIKVKKESITTNYQTKTLNIRDLKSGIYYFQIIPTKSIGKPYSGKFIKM
ncbi:MAG: T9SS type A sorting domain-containing protein [Saprospiraceae bacterium]|nr:T9SS type A sorting domain-containing protein [Saprospiraceae bacterium]